MKSNKAQNFTRTLLVALTSATISGVATYAASTKDARKAREEGRLEATSNLVSAVESMSKAARVRADYRFQEVVKRAQEGKIDVGQEIAYGYKIIDSYIEILERAIKNHANSIAKGKLNIKRTEDYQYLAEKP